jgi:hypothetical protein
MGGQSRLSWPVALNGSVQAANGRLSVEVYDGYVVIRIRAGDRFGRQVRHVGGRGLGCTLCGYQRAS